MLPTLWAGSFAIPASIPIAKLESHVSKHIVPLPPTSTRYLRELPRPLFRERASVISVCWTTPPTSSFIGPPFKRLSALLGTASRLDRGVACGFCISALLGGGDWISNPILNQFKPPVDPFKIIEMARQAGQQQRRQLSTLQTQTLLLLAQRMLSESLVTLEIWSAWSSYSILKYVSRPSRRSAPALVHHCRS
jgi:hypothetical protein